MTDLELHRTTKGQNLVHKFKVVNRPKRLSKLDLLEVAVEWLKREINRLDRENKKLKLENMKLKRKYCQSELFGDEIIDEEAL